MKNLLILFGGQSSEHEVSCLSAANIADCVDKAKYNIILVGITKSGKWLKVSSIEDIRDNTWYNSKIMALLSPDAQSKSLYYFKTVSESSDNHKQDEDTPVFLTKDEIDIVFPALHGLYGEDGTIQGLLELAKIPYVGCGVLSSAVSMDKFFTKLIVKTLNIRQAKYVPVFRRYLNDMDSVVKKVEASLSYPVFVKPSNAGSSQGVTKAYNREDLIKALLLAGKHDKKILVEETIVGRELECAVFSSGAPETSGVGEILAAADFYDYDAKYNNAESKTVLSPELPEGKTEEIRKAASQIFNAVDGFGLARVDFFLEAETNEVVFNEINTLPGFTAISMYPMLFEKAGIPKKDLIEKLIESASCREVAYVNK